MGKSYLIIGLFFFSFLLLSVTFRSNITQQSKITGAPPFGEAESTVPDSLDPFGWVRNWVRPQGPARVALQVGHWKNEELPQELARLVGNTGASVGEITEIEVNLKIAEETKRILESKGVIVDILPATVPEKYYADAFIAIHADGNEDSSRSGYKTSPPWRDFSGKSQILNSEISTTYALTTKMAFDHNITRNMRGYYAFSFWRYSHAIHPMTPAIIVEIGYLTSPVDRKIIVDSPTLSATGIAQGVITFLTLEGLL